MLEKNQKKKNQKKMLKIKNTVTEMKNAFNRLINGLDTVKERSVSLKRLIETCKLKMQREKQMKMMEQKTQELWG